MTANRMTLAIERARTRRPVTWLTLIGVLLLPVVIGGILVAALYNPVERLDGLNAAIVNEDEPVTIDDQYVPLGRQLTAGLVEGSDDQREQPRPGRSPTPTTPPTGLADGTYAGGRHDPRELLGGRDLDRSPAARPSGHDRGADAARQPRSSTTRSPRR